MNRKCKFCSLIFDIEEVPDFNCIVKGSTSQFYINVPAGDPYDGGYLKDVKYCPYCGRDLERRVKMKHYILFTKDELEDMLEGLEICHALSNGETAYFRCKEILTHLIECEFEKENNND